MIVSPVARRRNLLLCSFRSFSSVVQDCPDAGTNCRSSVQIGHVLGGASEDGYCVPQAVQMKAGIRTGYIGHLVVRQRLRQAGWLDGPTFVKTASNRRGSGQAEFLANPTSWSSAIATSLACVWQCRCEVSGSRPAHRFHRGRSMAAVLRHRSHLRSLLCNWSGCPIVPEKWCNRYGVNYSPFQTWIEIAHRPFIEINDATRR